MLVLNPYRWQFTNIAELIRVVTGPSSNLEPSPIGHFLFFPRWHFGSHNSHNFWYHIHGNVPCKIWTHRTSFSLSSRLTNTFVNYLVTKHYSFKITYHSKHVRLTIQISSNKNVVSYTSFSRSPRDQ